MSMKDAHSEIRSRVAAAWLALALLSPALAGADFQAGLKAVRAGDYATALDAWRPLAEGGDALSQLNLGMMYARGHGVKKDLKEAERWVRRAAEQGLAQAQSLLGTFYARGLGVEQDYKAAAGWFYQAANQNDPASQYDLAVLYANGQGVPQDQTQAYFWFKLAAAQGYAQAEESARRLARLMLPAQMEYAEQQVHDWLMKQYAKDAPKTSGTPSSPAP